MAETCADDFVDALELVIKSPIWKEQVRFSSCHRKKTSAKVDKEIRVISRKGVIRENTHRALQVILGALISD